jgi:hypothetical protein
MIMEEKLKQIFKKHGFTYDWDCDLNIPVVYIYVIWGDWKHDHICLKNAMQENGFIFAGEEVTEEDGSDCYSATHAYIYSL